MVLQKDFLGGPGVMTLGFQCREALGLIPGWGRSHTPCNATKKKRERDLNFKIKWSHREEIQSLGRLPRREIKLYQAFCMYTYKISTAECLHLTLCRHTA